MKKSKLLSSIFAAFAAIALVPFQLSAQTNGTTSGTSYITPGSGGNAAESGRSAARGQLIGAAVNVGAAVMYVKVCGTGPTGSWACPLAAIAGVAANMLANASGGSKTAGSSMSAFDPNGYQMPNYDYGNGTNGNGIVYVDGTNGVTGPGTNGTNGTNGNSIGTNGTTGPGGTTIPGTNLPATPAGIAGGINDVNKGLQDAGATISPDGRTMTTKDGRKFDLGAGGDGSEKGLLGMGLSPAEAAQAAALGKKFASQVADKYGQGKLGADGGGGGGRGPAASAAGDGSGGDGMGGMGRFLDPRMRNRPKAKVSGLTKKLGDDTIGVSGDDIFEMITRRYKARDQENQFLKD